MPAQPLITPSCLLLLPTVHNHERHRTWSGGNPLNYPLEAFLSTLFFYAPLSRKKNFSLNVRLYLVSLTLSLPFLFSLLVFIASILVLTGLSILLAAYSAQSLQYDEPLSKRVWTYYARMTMPEFVDSLFSFLSAFEYDTSVSALVFNDLYCELSGQPLKDLLPKAATPQPMSISVYSASSSYTPSSTATTTSSDYYTAHSTQGSSLYQTPQQVLEAGITTVQPMQEAYPAPVTPVGYEASKASKLAGSSSRPNKLVKGFNSIIRFARRNRGSKSTPTV